MSSLLPAPNARRAKETYLKLHHIEIARFIYRQPFQQEIRENGGREIKTRTGVWEKNV